MTSRIVPCSVSELFDEPAMAGLVEEYAEECGNALVGKPAPRRDIYENLEISGLGQCFAAYEERKLVGFAMLLLAVVPHYGLSCATVESIFVTRETNCGSRLMDAIEETARKDGATAIFYTAPLGSRMARLMFLCSGLYKHTNHVFCRRLA